MGKLDEAKIKHVLGVDFGKSKVGLALADVETKMAFAHSTLENNSQVIDKIVAIIQENNVEMVIIGLPTHQLRDEKENEVEKFAESIKQKAGSEIIFVDEMFTTKMAQDNLIEAGKKDLNKIDDKEAARIILQEYLDR